MAGQVPFLPPDFEPRERMILVEGETDTMAAWQALQALPEEQRATIGIVGLSGLNAYKERYAEELFGQAKRVFVVLDNDDPYTEADAAKAGEKAWASIRKSLGRKARRVKLPQGTNDLAEFFQAYSDWAAFDVLLEAANKPIQHYKPTDLYQPVPPTDWLVEDFFEKGVITMLAGDSGAGKSFIAMAAALAIAGGEKKFLGLNVKRHGRVLYIDEEQYLGLALQRFQALGITDKARDNISYLNWQGVDLYNSPELLLEQALDYDPELILIDSQSAVSVGAEENSNDDMSRLFKQSFRPLARDTGSALVVIHHTPNDNKGKPRGGGAIRASVDQVLSVIEAEAGGVKTGNLNIFPSKPRRLTAHLTVRIEGDMDAGEDVRINPTKEVM